MVGRMYSVSQKPDRGENRMTEEERMREVERISRRTKELVKIPSDHAKRMEDLYGPIEHIE